MISYWGQRSLSANRQFHAYFKFFLQHFFVIFLKYDRHAPFLEIYWMSIINVHYMLVILQKRNCGKPSPILPKYLTLFLDLKIRKSEWDSKLHQNETYLCSNYIICVLYRQTMMSQCQYFLQNENRLVFGWFIDGWLNVFLC